MKKRLRLEEGPEAGKNAAGVSGNATALSRSAFADTQGFDLI